MQQLSSLQLSLACRIFLSLAYPDAGAIPVKRRVYFDLPDDQPVANVLPPAACSLGVCQELRDATGTVCGYDLRLGSSGFPHLKLRVQLMTRGNEAWVYMVDTHDAFSKESRFPPPNHPDAETWMAMQGANRLLKGRIEAAFEQNGLATMNSILRNDLQR